MMISSSRSRFGHAHCIKSWSRRQVENFGMRFEPIDYSHAFMVLGTHSLCIHKYGTINNLDSNEDDTTHCVTQITVAYSHSWEQRLATTAEVGQR